MNDYSILFDKLGYKFDNLNILKLSLTHKSININIGKNNERLELLGDVILNSIVTIYLLEKLSKVNEGNIVKLKSLIISKKGLSKIAISLGLYNFILFKTYKVNFRSDKILSSFVESLFGGIFLDCKNFETTQNIFLSLLKNNKKEILNDIESYDYKSYVQVKFHEIFHITPQYILLDRFSVNNVMFFKIALTVNNKKLIAIDNSKIKAEQLVAKKCCSFMKWNIKDFYYNLF